MIRQTKEILSSLSKELQTRYYFVVFINIFSPFLDLFSISMLFPILNSVASGGSEQTAARRLLMLGILMIGKGIYEIFLTKVQASWECDCNWTLATRMFDLMLREDLTQHNLKNESQILHDVRQDVGSTILVLTYVKDILLDAILLTGYILLMFFLSGIIGVSTVLFLWLLMLLLRTMNRDKVLTYGREVREREIGLAGITVSTFHAFKEIAIQNNKSDITAKFSEASREKELVTKDYLVHQSFVSVILQNLTNAVIFILLALILLSGFDISKLISMVVLLITVLAKMIPASKNILLNINNISYNKHAVENTMNNCRRYQHITEKDASAQTYDYREASLEKAVYIKGLTFTYPDGAPILDNVDMEIPAGKTVALVGASGEGKTTLLDLIVGLLKPQSGAILYDDFDIASNQDRYGKSRTDIGSIVSYMPQAPTFHEGTVRDCVSFIAAPDFADEERVKDCLKTAMLYEDIINMPQGIDTVIGSGGVRLSGGQYQRLGLARALYKDFQLLVMDEGTSSLGTDVEETIFHALQNELKEKTVLLATHHRNLSEQCDIIYEIKESHVIRRK